MPRDIATVQAELADVKQAIREVLLGGQANAINNRALTRASLKDLREMEKDLQDELSRIERGRRRVTRIVPL